MNKGIEEALRILTGVADMCSAEGALVAEIFKLIGLEQNPGEYVMDVEDPRRESMNQLSAYLMGLKMGEGSIAEAITLVRSIRKLKGFNPQFPDLGDDMWLYPCDSDMGVMMMDVEIHILNARIEELETLYVHRTFA